MQCGILDWILDKKGILVEKRRNPNKAWSLVSSSLSMLIFQF